MVFNFFIHYEGFPHGTSGKEPPANARGKRCGFSIPGSGRSPGGGHGNPPEFLPGEPCGQRSLVDYSLRGHKESDMTEETACMHACMSTV